MAGPVRSTPIAGSSRQQPEYKVQPPRPPNAWILYRSDKLKDLPPSSERRAQADVSKIISEMWKNETGVVKLRYERLADAKKAEHQRMYPSYRFQPMKKEDKERLKEERKQEREKARLAKKSKGRGTTAVNATLPTVPPLPYAPPQYLLPPGYPPHLAMPHPYMVPYPPEARFGPAGPSPPLSAAPSPNDASASPEPQPCPDENVPVSSSSQLSTRPLPTPESQISSSSSQPLPANTLYLPSLPTSQQPSPNPSATQVLPPLLLQTSGPSQWNLPSTEVQFPSPQNTILPATSTEWNNMSTRQPNLESQNPEEFLNFDIPFNQTQSFTEFQQGVANGGLSLDSLQGLLSMTVENGVFNLSNIDPSDLLAHPQGELEVAMRPQSSAFDFTGDLFSNFDFSSFEQQIGSTSASSSNTNQIAAASIADDLAALFQTPNNPEAQEYTAAQQRQPSLFTQDVMQFLNLEAMEGSVQDDTSMPPPPSVPPQQVRPPAQHAPAMPIFTQMTNTPAVATGAATAYAPPAGAIYSSTRRVAGSWKPSFAIPDSPVEEPVQSWTIVTN